MKSQILFYLFLLLQMKAFAHAQDSVSLIRVDSIRIATVVRQEASARFTTQLKQKEDHWLHLLAYQQRRANITLVVGGVILLTLLFLAIYLYEQHRRVRAQLAGNKLLLEKQTTDLNDLKHVKSDFFLNLNHELRTPLTLIQGNTHSALSVHKLPLAAEEALRKVDQHTRQLSSLVDDLLDISRLERDDYQVSLVPVNLSEYLQNILLAWNSDRIKVTYQSAEENLTSLLDTEAFRKVMHTLLKFTEERLEAGEDLVVAVSQKEDQAKILVSMDREVIDPVTLPDVFDRFSIANRLAIAKELTEAMSGSIVAKSGENRTQFTLTYPLSDQRAEAVGVIHLEDVVHPFDRAEHEELHIPSGTYVLIVEDNVLLQEYLFSMLHEQFEIGRAMNGRQALERINERVPDLIVTDIMMPEMDGFELIDRLKAEPKYENIPVIVLTAIAEDRQKLKGLRMGVDDYIIKPFEPNELLVKIANLINNLRNRIRWAREYQEENEVDIGKSEQDQKLILAIREYVLENISDKNLSVPALAHQIGVSERQLYRKVSAAVGMRPAELISEIKLQYAREMMTAGRIEKLSQISAMVGFENASYFSKVYFNRFGKKPTEYISK